MDFDLNDPKTKELFDYYGEDRKGDFETAYVYMKYLYEFVSTIFLGFGQPPIPEIAGLDPAVKQKIYSKLAGIASGFGSNETSIYHSKVITLKEAEKLVTQKEDLNIDVPETVVPFKLAKNIILNNPGSIAVGTCPCRKANPKSSCMPDPMEACLFLGDPHASFIVEHNPKFRKISQEEAVAILEDCDKRGFIHCAYFKKDMGSRFYAICNCCSCCCFGAKNIEMYRKSGSKGFVNLVSSGYVAEVSDDCIGCGDCVEWCQFKAISMKEDQSVAVIDLVKCMGCGVCEGNCPSGALSLRKEPSKGGVLDIDELTGQAMDKRRT